MVVSYSEREAVFSEIGMFNPMQALVYFQRNLVLDMLQTTEVSVAHLFTTRMMWSSCLSAQVSELQRL